MTIDTSANEKEQFKLMSDDNIDRRMAEILARIAKMGRTYVLPQPSRGNLTDAAFIAYAIDDLRWLMGFAELWQSHQQTAYSLYPAVYAAWEKACEADKPALEEILVLITPMAQARTIPWHASTATADSNNTDLRYPEVVNFVIPDVD